MSQEHPASSKPLLSVKDVLWLLYLYPLRLFAWRLSPRNLHRLGRVLEPVFQILVAGRRRIARARMSKALSSKCSAAEIDRISKRFVANAVWRALDDLHLMDPESAARIAAPQIHGFDHLTRALSRGHGALLLTGHFYAMRLGKRHLAGMGYPVMSVRKGEPPDEWMGRLGARFIQPRYVEFLHQVIGDEVFIEDPQCSLKIFRRLRSGGLVNVHFDASFTRHPVFLPFLGGTKRFATGMIEIVRLSNCAVVPMQCLGNQRGWSIRFDEPLTLHPAASREEFADRNIQQFVDTLERQILEHAEEWEGWIRL
ncbi:MAG: lysophospholipid acyltransferase family protein [Bryobacterales bacterium]|nr:lysophospholipid acyltransferase family protein [Bryobacterales bacterium]